MCQIVHTLARTCTPDTTRPRSPELYSVSKPQETVRVVSCGLVRSLRVCSANVPTAIMDKLLSKEVCREGVYL